MLLCAEIELHDGRIKHQRSRFIRRTEEGSGMIVRIGFIAVRRMIAPMRVLEEHFLDAARGQLKPISNQEFPKGQSDATNMFHAFNQLVEAQLERGRLVECSIQPSRWTEA